MDWAILGKELGGLRLLPAAVAKCEKLKLPTGLKLAPSWRKGSELEFLVAGAENMKGH